jgi:hypothetical protein
MADYYSILTKTVANLPQNTAPNRAFVYAKARQAIEARLRALQPSPGPDAIARQMQILDESIRRIENEQMALDAAAAIAPQPQKSEPRVAAAPQSAAAPAIVAREPDIVPIRPQSTAPAYDASLDAIDAFDRRAAARRGQPRRRSGGWLGAAISFLLLAALVGGAWGLWINKEPLMAALGIKPPAGEAGGQPPAKGDGKAAGQAGGQSGGQSGGQAGGSSAGGVPVVREAGKENVRLTESGDSVAGGAQSKDGQTGQGQAGQGQAGQGQAGQGQAGQGAGAGQQADAGQQTGKVNPVNEGGSGQTGQSADAQAGSGQGGDSGGQGVPAIGQKAFLYEEGTAGAGATRDNAAIVWSLVQEPPADGKAPEAVIRGQFEVPGRGLTMQLSIKRNGDEALPASHVIEMLFSPSPEFSGGNVDAVARFVMKANEQARGEGLVAVPARIDAGYFLIALNNLPQAIETNRKLLTETSWIDVPFAYTNGKRGLIALEKGAIGDKVFKDAFASWDKR